MLLIIAETELSFEEGELAVAEPELPVMVAELTCAATELTGVVGELPTFAVAEVEVTVADSVVDTKLLCSDPDPGSQSNPDPNKFRSESDLRF